MIKELAVWPLRFIKIVYYKFRLKNIGWNSQIISPLRIDGAKSIFVGDRVYVGYKSWLASIPLTGCKESKLILEDGCSIGHFNHIYATKSIVLHKNVLTADKVYISDNLHGYENVEMPIMYQPIIQNGTVEIGEGTWLGENACVLGVKIGKHCVIGANSVVTHDIPDYSVAVGVPARIVRRYNPSSQEWDTVKNQ